MFFAKLELKCSWRMKDGINIDTFRKVFLDYRWKVPAAATPCRVHRVCGYGCC